MSFTVFKIGFHLTCIVSHVSSSVRRSKSWEFWNKGAVRVIEYLWKDWLWEFEDLIKWPRAMIAAWSWLMHWAWFYKVWFENFTRIYGLKGNQKYKTSTEEACKTTLSSKNHFGSQFILIPESVKIPNQKYSGSTFSQISMHTQASHALYKSVSSNHKSM